MSVEILQQYEPQIEQIALAQHITNDEALARILQAGVEQLKPVSSSENAPLRQSYESFFGAVKDGYGSKEAVDHALEKMRSEW